MFSFGLMIWISLEPEVLHNLRLFQLLSLGSLQTPHLNSCHHWPTSEFLTDNPNIQVNCVRDTLQSEGAEVKKLRTRLLHNFFCIAAPSCLVALWLWLLCSQWVKNLSDCIHHAAPQLALISKGGERHSCEQHSVPWSTFSSSDWAHVGDFSNTGDLAYFVFLSII